jgi:hypothetical protein
VGQAGQESKRLVVLAPCLAETGEQVDVDDGKVGQW